MSDTQPTRSEPKFRLCRDCEAWTTENKIKGDCHRKSPRRDDEYGHAEWPTTYHDDGCCDSLPKVQP